MDARTEKIVTLFQDSWIEIEARYNNLINNYPGWERFKPLLAFITKMRTDGEDRYFRAGTSLSTLLISRSVAHGLREDQRFVSIDAINPGVYEVKLREPGKTYREFRVATLDDPQLFKVLKTLKETLVD